MQESLIPGLRQGIYKVSLKCSVVPEMKEVLKKHKATVMGIWPREVGASCKNRQTVKLEEFEQQNK